jgi:hypothetical protein
MKIKSNKLRASARDQDCTLRLVGVCNFNPETTVLCHVGVGSGFGTKSGDNMAVFGCSSCHAEIDAKPKGFYGADIIRALGETQQIWIDNGLMVVK